MDSVWEWWRWWCPQVTTLPSFSLCCQKILLHLDRRDCDGKTKISLIYSLMYWQETWITSKNCCVFHSTCMLHVSLWEISFLFSKSPVLSLISIENKSEDVNNNCIIVILLSFLTEKSECVRLQRWRSLHGDNVWIIVLESSKKSVKHLLSV